MEWIIVSMLVCGFLGALIGSGKNRAGDGLVLGMLFGLIGLIVIVFLGPREEGKGGRLFGAVVIIVVILGGVTFGLFWLADKNNRANSVAEYGHDHAGETPQPSDATPTPAIVRAPATPRPTPDPRAIAREIERKYGAPR